MEIQSTEQDIYSPSGGSKWYSTSGIGAQGQAVHCNYFVEDEEEVAALAHAANIVHDVSLQPKAEYVGKASEYKRLFK